MMWEAFRDRIEEYTPERVAAITGLRAEQIVALGARIARTRPTAIRASQVRVQGLLSGRESGDRRA